MAEAEGEILTNTEIQDQINKAGEAARVSPFNPDFLLFALPFAFVVDALDIVLELTGILIIPKLIGIGIDVFTFVVIIGWIYWRVKKIEESKRTRQTALRRAAQRGIQRLAKLQKIGKVSPQVFERYLRRYGQQMGRGGRLIAGVARKPLTRTLIRGGIVLLGEIVWLVGLIPFWTIAVVLTLREK